MTPSEENLQRLAEDLKDDSVAVGQLGEQYPDLEGYLHEVVKEAAENGRGDYAFVVLDEMPAVPTDMRNIAQELLNMTDVDTVVLRTPVYGTIVSNEHSRAEIEAAEIVIFQDNDYVASFRWLTETLGQDPVSWGWVNAAIFAAVVAVAVFAALSFRPVKREELT
ncbi:hypothetical protein FRX94_00715 [Corynebacterium canis]|uniref:Uncharacterized protein n=1 Tax=Corynebacterium canis TaxID=679663 RepID=A0A5C5UTV2_9CORY|nr:DUF6676 family protein [Corynebacterium canis]TWT29077.1 hypothetical protein FRX94_00715 [Corynebacterium canis]WJY75306.1 hypothetical protein CCANI_07355 [Corynebacterium canis]